MEGGRFLFLSHYTTHSGACQIFPILRELWDWVIVMVLWIMVPLYLGQIVRWGTLMGSCKLGKY